jgi:hypothetical protein
LQRLVDRAAAAAGAEELVHKFAGVIAVHHGGREDFRHLRVIAIEIDTRIVLGRVIRTHQRRIPVIATENFVGALPALRDFYVFGNFLRQQIKTDGVVAHHRLRHCRNRPWKCVDRSRSIDANAMVVGRKATRDQVGIAELVAFHVADLLEADGEGLQIALSLRRGWQPEANCPTPPDSRTATGTSATRRRSTDLPNASRIASRQSASVKARSAA